MKKGRRGLSKGRRSSLSAKTDVAAAGSRRSKPQMHQNRLAQISIKTETEEAGCLFWTYTHGILKVRQLAVLGACVDGFWRHQGGSVLRWVR